MDCFFFLNHNSWKSQPFVKDCSVIFLCLHWFRIQQTLSLAFLFSCLHFCSTCKMRLFYCIPCFSPTFFLFSAFFLFHLSIPNLLLHFQFFSFIIHHLSKTLTFCYCLVLFTFTFTLGELFLFFLYFFLCFFFSCFPIYLSYVFFFFRC